MVARETTLEELVRAHSRLLFRVAYSVLRDAQEAEDAVQDTFLRVLKNERRLKSINEPRAWLVRIAFRVALDRRKREPTLALEEAPEPVARGDVQGELAREQIDALVRKLMEALPPELRLPLALSTVEELTSREIGEALGIPEGTVRTRLMKARQVLKEKLNSVMEARHG